MLVDEKVTESDLVAWQQVCGDSNTRHAIKLVASVLVSNASVPKGIQCIWFYNEQRTLVELIHHHFQETECRNETRGDDDSFAVSVNERSVTHKPSAVSSASSGLLNGYCTVRLPEQRVRYTSQDSGQGESVHTQDNINSCYKYGGGNGRCEIDNSQEDELTEECMDDFDFVPPERSELSVQFEENEDEIEPTATAPLVNETSNEGTKNNAKADILRMDELRKADSMDSVMHKMMNLNSRNMANYDLDDMSMITGEVYSVFEGFA